MNLTTTTNYGSDVLQFLTIGEGEPTDRTTGQVYAYADSLGIPTMGVGINLREHLNLVLAYLGFDVSGAQLTGAAATREKNYIDAITAVVKDGVFARGLDRPIQ